MCYFCSDKRDDRTEELRSTIWAVFLLSPAWSTFKAAICSFFGSTFKIADVTKIELWNLNLKFDSLDVTEIEAGAVICASGGMLLSRPPGELEIKALVNMWQECQYPLDSAVCYLKSTDAVFDLFISDRVCFTPHRFFLLLNPVLQNSGSSINVTHIVFICWGKV